MHIERIEIERCGALAQLTIDSLGPGVQVLHGTNEIGKTSLLEFVRHFLRLWRSFPPGSARSTTAVRRKIMGADGS